MDLTQLNALLNAIGFANVFLGIICFAVCGLLLVEVIRLSIVIYRSVKGRMNRV